MFWVGQLPFWSAVLHHVAGPSVPTHTDMPAVSGWLMFSAGLRAARSEAEFTPGYVALQHDDE